jgi:hypothetical protein
MKSLNHPFRMQEYTLSNRGILGKYKIIFFSIVEELKGIQKPLDIHKIDNLHIMEGPTRGY